MKSAWYWLIGLLFALLFWLIEALMHAIFLGQASFYSELWPHTANEWWMRTFVAFLFIIMGGVAAWLHRRFSKLHKQLVVFQRAFDSLTESVLVTDHRNRIVYVNQAYCMVTGYSKSEALGRNPSVSKSGKQDKRFYQRLWCELLQQGSWQGELWNRKKSGELYPEWLSITVLRDEGGDIDFHIGIFTDITARKQTEQVMRHYAYYDPLTNLPNRRFFGERLEQAMRYAKRNQEALAIIFVDLDHFKRINDDYGHDAGDQYLQAFSRAILKILRDTDTLSRFGGDEFVILLTNIGNQQDAERVAKKILSLSSVEVNGEKIDVDCSIGIAVYPEDSNKAEQLIEKADQAMYYVKRNGRHSVQLSGRCLPDGK